MATYFSGHLLTGDHASRPAAGDVPEGTLYSCTDHALVYQSDGASWSTWAILGAAIADILDLPTAETDTDLVLRPDGAGGVEFAAEGGGHTFKQTIRNGGGDLTTTSATFTPLDSTNIGYLTLDLAIGDVVRCTLSCTVSTTDATGSVAFDFEVDRPTSANINVANGADSGVGQASGTLRKTYQFAGHFVATEAGVHGFRPIWLEDGSGTARVSNAASGGSDSLILFTVEKLGPVTA